jgi:hypothetical protein
MQNYAKGGLLSFRKLRISFWARGTSCAFGGDSVAYALQLSVLQGVAHSDRVANWRSMLTAFDAALVLNFMDSRPVAQLVRALP